VGSGDVYKRQIYIVVSGKSLGSRDLLSLWSQVQTLWLLL
jgi:hypothetical protein